jgi:plasmid stabilization system protein ParE
MKAEFYPTASEEIVESTASHELELPGLGDRFIDEIERVIEVLYDQPSIAQSVDEKFRRILLARFPYSVIYSIRSKRIWVIAVAHHRRRSGYWQERFDRSQIVRDRCGKVLWHFSALFMATQLDLNVSRFNPKT